VSRCLDSQSAQAVGQENGELAKLLISLYGLILDLRKRCRLTCLLLALERQDEERCPEFVYANGDKGNSKDG
jgi:hypothetical protein